MIPLHLHAWQRGECRKCGAGRCTEVNTAGWRCTEQDRHDGRHQYADGTTSGS